MAWSDMAIYASRTVAANVKSPIRQCAGNETNAAILFPSIDEPKTLPLKQQTATMAEMQLNSQDAPSRSGLRSVEIKGQLGKRVRGVLKSKPSRRTGGLGMASSPQNRARSRARAARWRLHS
jgi:hypothetical protein